MTAVEFIKSVISLVAFYNSNRIMKNFGNIFTISESFLFFVPMDHLFLCIDFTLHKATVKYKDHALE